MRTTLIMAATAAALLAVPAVLIAQNRPPPPEPSRTPGQPIETRAPELDTDKAAFPGQTRAPYKKTVDYQVAALTDQLKAPWSLALLPDGRFLVTEKAGTLRLVDAKGVVSAPIAGVPMVVNQGQAGLWEVALDRDFARNRRIFLSYSEPVGEANSNLAIASATLDPAGAALQNLKVIFRAKPDLPRARVNNQGGKIAITRDGTLFATVGDRSQSPPWDMAQKLDTHLGKVIHITVDGAPARGNPFIGKAGALPEIWSLGHRSEEGLAFDPSGRLWETEHGPRGGDELNILEPGKNYGWPVIVHGIDYPGAKINGGKTEQAGMEQGRYYWDPVIAPSGLAFYEANLFPAWKGSLFVGALRGQALHRLTLNGLKVVDEEPLLFDQRSRIRDVRVGADGAIYVITDGGKLLKVTAK